MTKKKIITVAVLIFVLALLVAALMIVRRGNVAKPEDGADSAPASDGATDEAVIYVSPGHDWEDMIKLSYKNDIASLSFEKNANDAWRLTDDPDFPLESSFIRAMASAVSDLSAIRRIDEELSEYGFDTPSLTVYCEYADGSAVSLTAGAQNEFDNAVYLRDEDTGDVFLVSANFASFFAFSREDLLCLDSLPDFNISDVVSVTVRDPAGNESTITDDDGISDSAYLFKKIDFSADGAFFADDDALAVCGLSTNGPFAEITFTQKVTQSNDDGSMSTVDTEDSFKVVFGDSLTVTETDENGNETEREYYYYALSGGHVVYRISSTYYNEIMRFASYNGED